MEESGIGGPIFISIGDADKLNAFLDFNPFMPRDRFYVEGNSFGAYKAAGFNRFDQVDEKMAEGGLKLTVPNLSLGEWMSCISNMGKLSPIPEGMTFGEIPEGVLWVGGTFVIQGDEVVYQWNDIVPGNHPEIQDVIQAGKIAAEDAGSARG